MKLTSKPGDCPSINVAGTEYSPDASGAVEIVNPVHIAAAKKHGFVEVEVPAATEIQTEGE
jgi:hypothetical protein